MSNLSAEILQKIQLILEPCGFECHPFKVGWYNAKVQDAFKLSYPDDTLAFIILSTPSMFEKCFIPFLKGIEQPLNGVRDPLDQCIGQKINQIKQEFEEQEIDVLHDFEMDHNRRPRVLVQTAGHVSGAVYFYQRHDVTEQPWTPRQKICGVAMHPRYGGWFGLRSVLVFRDVVEPALPYRPPHDLIPDDATKISLLEKFNYTWQDWSYRDVVAVEERYSAVQKRYFATLPKLRLHLIDRIRRGDDLDDPPPADTPDTPAPAPLLDQGHANT